MWFILYGVNILPVITPKISIITVCFNSAKTIHQTIESVLNQSYTNIEYIVVDGKSTDNTMAIIQSYEQKFKDKGIIFRYISEPDNGIYDAMNKGIKMSAGEWIGIINSDDWYELDACELVINAYQNNSKIMIFAGAIRSILNLNNESYYQTIIPSLEHINFRMTLCHPAVFVKADLYRQRNFDSSYKVIADWELMKYFANSQVEFCLVDRVLANFTEGGISNVRNLGYYLELLKVLKATYPVYAYYFVGKMILRKEIVACLKPAWFTAYRRRQMLQNHYRNKLND